MPSSPMTAPDTTPAAGESSDGESWEQTVRRLVSDRLDRAHVATEDRLVSARNDVKGDGDLLDALDRAERELAQRRAEMAELRKHVELRRGE